MLTMTNTTLEKVLDTASHVLLWNLRNYKLFGRTASWVKKGRKETNIAETRRSN